MTQITYVNGSYVSAKNAVVSVQDRGFRYGDGVFETIAVHGGVPYQWELHLARLEAGLKALEIPAPSEDLLEVSLRLLARNDLSD
ncbi:MAG: D-amino acid aminotransferase, partial [Alphaproteobacteria bacterium]|nr:D-amino acid aminotransferase [Alphaproteobacteria bacterium]